MCTVHACVCVHVSVCVHCACTCVCVHVCVQCECVCALCMHVCVCACACAYNNFSECSILECNLHYTSTSTKFYFTPIGGVKEVKVHH